MECLEAPGLGRGGVSSADEPDPAVLADEQVEHAGFVDAIATTHGGECVRFSSRDARIDMLGDVPAKLTAGSGEELAEVYAGTNLQMVYEPETSQKCRCG